MTVSFAANTVPGLTGRLIKNSLSREKYIYENTATVPNTSVSIKSAARSSAAISVARS